MLIATTARVFPPEIPLEAQCAALAEAGFDGVELNLEPAYGLELPLPEARARTIRSLLGISGLRLASVYSRAQWTQPIAHPDPAVRERGRQVLVDLVAAAERLECAAALVIPGWVDNTLIAPDQAQVIPHREALTYTRETIASLVDDAERAGVVLCLENVAGKLFYDPISYREFIESFASPYVRSYFDPANVLTYGFPEHWLPEVRHLLQRIHVKDARPALFPVNAVVNLYEGEMNWPVLIRQLAATDYDSWLTAEVLPVRHDYPARFLHKLRDDLDFLRAEIRRERQELSPISG
jgi:L-ribulose-5-phosphate 3-epimerase